MSQTNENNWTFLKNLPAWIAPVAAICTILFSPLVWDLDPYQYAILVLCTGSFLFLVWRRLRVGLIRRILLTVIIMVLAGSWAYAMWRAGQPQFEITALDTLDQDKNAYELTDFLIDSQQDLAKNGMAITVTLEVVPRYPGKRYFGRVIALVGGSGGKPQIEKTLWDTFSSDSRPARLALTLPELVKASGIRANADLPDNRFETGYLPFQQARLPIRIASEANKEHPFSEQEVVIRNAPWDFRSVLLWRNGKRQADVYVKNLGGAGDFTVMYDLVHQYTLAGSGQHPVWNGTALIQSGNEPKKLVHLAPGQTFTATVPIPETLDPGHYILETWALKKQPYVLFLDKSANWDDMTSVPAPWWFSDGMKSNREVFIADPFPLGESNALIQAEWQRLKDTGVIDLGLALESEQAVTSQAGTKGSRQRFQQGEIFVHHGKAYALYGPVLDHYRALLSGPVKETALKNIGFPITPLQPVTSSLGTQGTLVEFEGRSPDLPPAAIYASRKGVAVVWQGLRQAHLTDGGHAAGLGFPLADEQYFQDSTGQMFESGYVVYYFPKLSGEQRDWSRPIAAYPYLASRGVIFDVHAEAAWQNTGVQVKAGDRITIVQIAGVWTSRPGGRSFDANGDVSLGLQDQKGVPLAFDGSLMGRIGEGNDNVFPAGRWSTTVAPVGGPLYLAMNANNHADSTGLVTLQIMVDGPK